MKQTLQILQDKGYQEKAPELPWDRYIYMTHQHMASSISYHKDTAMSAEDMANIMESVYIVNQRQVREAEARGERTPMRWIFPYHAIEYYCGMHSLEQLLAEMEKLLDAVDPTDFSADGMYGMGSLLAFYCQYLQQYPEYLPERVGYLEGLICGDRQRPLLWGLCGEDHAPLCAGGLYPRPDGWGGGQGAVRSDYGG